MIWHINADIMRTEQSVDNLLELSEEDQSVYIKNTARVIIISSK